MNDFVKYDADYLLNNEYYLSCKRIAFHSLSNQALLLQLLDTFKKNSPREKAICNLITQNNIT